MTRALPIRTRICCRRAAELAIFTSACVCVFPCSVQAAERFWLPASGTVPFSNPTAWAATSGGAGGAGLPGAVDTANFDNSGASTADFLGATFSNAILEVENGNVTFDLGGGVYIVTSTARIGTFPGTGTTARLTLFDGTMDVDTNGDDITIGAQDTDGFLTVSTDAVLGVSPSSPDLLVGNEGSGTLTVNNGGRVVANTCTLAPNAASSTGTMIVAGVNSLANIAGDLRVGSSGTGVLSVQSGAQLLSPAASIATSAGSIGSATVTGAGSSWVTSGAVTAGNLGTATLNVASGASLNAVPTLTIGAMQGSAGTTNVTGAGSFLFTQELIAGSSGAGTLNVSSGAELSTSTLIAGRFTAANSKGTVNVSGAGSSLSCFGLLECGAAGPGFVTVSGGGYLKSVGAAIGGTTGQGLLNVTGSGSRWEDGGVINVSTAAFGTLNVEDGGSLTGEVLNINDPAGSGFGTLVFNGGEISVRNFTRAAGATLSWTDGTLNILGGVFNNASLPLTIDGGTPAALPKLHLQRNAITTGFNAVNLTVGSLNRGELELSGTSSLALSNLFIAGFAGSTGIVTVGGTTAGLTTNSVVNVGGTASAGGTGVLNVNHGGAVSAGTFLSLWPGGTVNLNGGTLSMAAAGLGGGRFNFNSGMLVFMSTGTYTGGFTPLYDVLLGPDHVLGDGRTITYAGGLAPANLNLVVDGGSFNVATTLNLDPGCSFEVHSGVLSAATSTVSAGASVLLAGGRMTLGSTYNNSGTLRLASAPGASILTGTALNNFGLITGGGQIGMGLTNGAASKVRVEGEDHLVFTAAASNTGGRMEVFDGGDLQFLNSLANNSLVSVTGGTLQVAGLTTNNSSTGLISAYSGTLWFDGGLNNNGSLTFPGGVSHVYGDVTNNGGAKIIVSGGATAIFYDDVVNTGSTNVSASGTLASVAIYLGALSGTGVSGAGKVFIEGDARPGASPGTMSFGGDVSFGPLAKYQAEIAGTTPGTQYDRITAAGTLGLGGALQVTFISGFVPAAGMSFDVWDAGAVNGAFDSLSLPALPAGLFWHTNKVNTTGVLSIGVTPDSYAGFAALYGLTTPSAGDEDGDGLSNELEYTLALNPVRADLGGPGLPVLIKTSGTADDIFRFEMPSLSAPDVRLEIEASTDLVTWQPMALRLSGAPWTGAFPPVLTPGLTGPGFDRVTMTRPDAGAVRRHYRLTVRIVP